MESLRFVTEETSDSYPLDAESYLYNSREYLGLKEKVLGRRLTFCALAGDVAVARIHFFFIKTSHGEVAAVSLPASPFGSVEYAKALSKENLAAFIRHVKEELVQFKVKRITIKDCIPAYRAAISSNLVQALQEVGFDDKEALVNHHLKVDRIPLEHKMHRMERKRLRKCRRLKMTFKEEPLSTIDYYYRFLQKCRQEKGWSLSLSYEEMLASLRAMPDRYFIYAVHYGDECLAASLAIKVNEHILYDFYHDSKIAFKSWSPVVFLVQGMYQYCQKTDISILDLGTSLTPGLQQFKQHLGGMSSFKHTYQFCV